MAKSQRFALATNFYLTALLNNHLSFTFISLKNYHNQLLLTPKHIGNSTS